MDQRFVLACQLRPWTVWAKFTASFLSANTLLIASAIFATKMNDKIQSEFPQLYKLHSHGRVDH